MSQKRDVQAAYKAALIEEHTGYVRAGRDKDAAVVAKILKEQHGYEVSKRATAKAAAAPERADHKPAEDTSEKKPEPRKATAPKPAKD